MSILAETRISSPKVDWATTTDPNELLGGTFGGQTYYVPLSGDNPLYRLFLPSPYDHMDSMLPGEGGYETQVILGSPYPLSSMPDGTQQLFRISYNNYYDHRTPQPTTGCGQTCRTEPLLGAGYPRYGRTGERLVTLRGSEMTIKANYVAGGAVSELWWNGKQFVNDHDYGRQVQVAVFLDGIDVHNPTEAGDLYGWPNGLGAPDAGWAHGSPLLHYSIANKVLRTTTRPLQWDPRRHGGGARNPVLWNGTISKEIVLDFSTAFPRVARWKTTVGIPPPHRNFFKMEIVTAYLNSEFTHYYSVDASTEDGLVDLTTWVPNNSCVDSTIPYLQVATGGVMIATADGNYALGIYRSDPTNEFMLCKFLTSGQGGKYGYDTTKWSLLYHPPAGISSGTHSYVAYLVVGTVASVTNDMRELYLAGY